jgi:hypothetical protein
MLSPFLPKRRIRPLQPMSFPLSKFVHQGLCAFGLPPCRMASEEGVGQPIGVLAWKELEEEGFGPRMKENDDGFWGLIHTHKIVQNTRRMFLYLEWTRSFGHIWRRKQLIEEGDMPFESPKYPLKSGFSNCFRNVKIIC